MYNIFPLQIRGCSYTEYVITWTVWGVCFAISMCVGKVIYPELICIRLTKT